MGNRREFIKTAGKVTISAGLFSSFVSCNDLLDESDALNLTSMGKYDLFFKISLAQWSLHKSFWAGDLDNLDFARTAKEDFGIDAVEYVNQFFIDKAEDMAYLNEMNLRASDHGVKNVLIMIDMEGSLATLNENARKKSVENHYKWINTAKVLGCHAIRVNAAGKGKRESVASAVVESLGTLCEYASGENISVIVENHGGYSSDADWLTSVMQQVNMENCGVLPDFGNFTISLFPPTHFDTYDGIKKLMPYAKGVSAKSHDFDSMGNDKNVDFPKALALVREAGFNGYVGIEYEGYKLSEKAGIKATKQLLIKAGQMV